MAKKKTKSHEKPSTKELDENIKKVVEEVEKAEAGEEETPVEPTPSEPAPSKEIIKDVLRREKEKSTASAQESQILHAKNKKINEALDRARQTPEPTEAEMASEYADWEMMSDFEKKMAKDTHISKKRFEALDDITKEFKDSDKWQEKVEGFITDPKTLTDNPDLDGREDEFKLFATKPTRRGVEFSDLVSAFLYTSDKEKPAKKKGKMFETGTGGPSSPQSKDAGKISIDEAIALRNRDYNTYKQYLKAGKIATDFEK